MKRISWTDHVRNEVLQRGKEKIKYHTSNKKGRLVGLVTPYAVTAF